MSDHTQPEQLPPLAAAEDVEALLGRSLTTSELATVEADLAKLSGRFRREARQRFTPGTSTHRAKVNGRAVVLHERPVLAVSAVTLEDGRPVGYTWHDGPAVQLADTLGDHRFVLVTYDHGGVPAEVRAAIAEAAKRPFDTDKAAKAGATQVSRTAGPFTEARTFAAWALGAEARLSPDDLALARSFRPQKPPTAWVMQP